MATIRPPSAHKAQDLINFHLLILTLLTQGATLLAAQYTAGFLASAVVFLVYWDALVWWVFVVSVIIMIIFVIFILIFVVYWDAHHLHHKNSNHHPESITRYEHDRGAYRTTPDTAAIFATYPSPHLTYPVNNMIIIKMIMMIMIMMTMILITTMMIMMMIMSREESPTS